MQKDSSSEAQLDTQYLPDSLQCCEYDFLGSFMVRSKCVEPYLHSKLQALRMGRMHTLKYCTLNLKFVKYECSSLQNVLKCTSEKTVLATTVILSSASEGALEDLAQVQEEFGYFLL